MLKWLIGGLCSLRSMAVLSGALPSGEAAKTHVNEGEDFSSCSRPNLLAFSLPSPAFII